MNRNSASAITTLLRKNDLGEQHFHFEGGSVASFREIVSSNFFPPSPSAVVQGAVNPLAYWRSANWGKGRGSKLWNGKRKENDGGSAQYVRISETGKRERKSEKEERGERSLRGPGGTGTIEKEGGRGYHGDPLNWNGPTRCRGMPALRGEDAVISTTTVTLVSPSSPPAVLASPRDRRRSQRNYAKSSRRKIRDTTRIYVPYLERNLDDISIDGNVFISIEEVRISKHRSRVKYLNRAPRDFWTNVNEFFHLFFLSCRIGGKIETRSMVRNL